MSPVILPSGWTGFNSGCCVDTTERGQQLIAQEVAFSQFPTINGGRRTSWAYVSPTGDCITLVGDGNCALGNMAYKQTALPPNPDCCQLNRFLGGNPTVFDHPALIDPDPFASAVNTSVGAADEPMYSFSSGGGVVEISAYYPNSNTHVVYNHAFNAVQPDAIAKKGNRFYAYLGTSAQNGFARHIVVYDAQAGGDFLEDWDSLENFRVITMNATENYLVCFCTDLTQTILSIKKLSLVDGSIAESIDITHINLHRSFAVSDDLVYLLTNTAMYYLSGTDLVFVGRAPGLTLSAFGGNAFFSGGVFYWGQAGFGDANADIYKIAIQCPEGGPLIASISTGATVAAGSAINVTWSGILDPTAGDRIELRPAPPAGDLGFVGAALATLNTGGPLSDGTLPFTIPALTTPGNYIFNLTRTDAGVILIATSNVFTVT
jgi:hypothetical protein